MKGKSNEAMNCITEITEKELKKKVADGVSKKVVWKQPLLLLTKSGSDYNYIHDTLNDLYRIQTINTDPSNMVFVRTDNQLELSINGVIVDGHKPEVQLYEYLGGPLAYDEKIHRYCIDLFEYEVKPVISFICVTDKNCSVDRIPEWIKEKFEVVLLELPY